MDEKSPGREHREKLILEHDPVYEVNTDGMVVSWNEGAKTAYGWDEREAVGKYANDLFKSGFYLNLYEKIAASDKNHIWTGELLQHKKDGTKIDVSSHAILHRDGEGRPKGIIFINRDITISRGKSEKARLSGEKMAVTFDSIGDGVLATDTEGRIIMMNRVAEKLTGWSRSEAQGKPVDEVFSITNNDTGKKVIVPVEQTVRTGRVQTQGRHTMLVSKNNRKISIAGSCAPVSDSGGRVTGVVLIFRDITEAMKREEALAAVRKNLAEARLIQDEYRNYLERLIDTMREALIVIDSRMKIVSVSGTFCKLFGFKPGEIIGKSFYEIGRGDWGLKKLKQLLRGLFLSLGAVTNHEVQKDFQGIGRRTMLLNAGVIRGGRKNENLILIVFEDITERKKAADDLEKYNMALRMISNINQELMHSDNVKDFLKKSCSIIYREKTCRFVWIGLVSGLNREKITPEAFAGNAEMKKKYLKMCREGSFTPEEPAKEALKTGAESIQENIPKQSDTEKPGFKEKKNPPMSVIALPLKTKGKTFGVVVIYSSHLGLFTEAEIKLPKEMSYDISFGINMIILNKAKNEAEKVVEKAASFPELNPEPISEIDTGGSIIYANPIFKKLFPKIRELTFAHEWFKGISGYFWALRKRKKEVITRDIKVCGRDYFQTMVYMPEDKTIRTYGVDITNRKLAESQLKKLYSEMEIKVSQKTEELAASRHLADLGTLAASVAHELRNPIGVINVAAYNLRKKLKSGSGRGLKHVINIEKKVAESGKIINNLLVYSKMKMPEFEQISLYKLLLETEDAVRRGFDGKKIRLVNSLKAIKNMVMEADPLQLREVFTNILTNSYQAIEGKRGKVEVKAFTRADKSVCVSIKDSGTGISREDMQSLFKPFFTRKIKGTGLGLVISKTMTEMHGGTISVNSKNGKGSSFIICLPVKRVVW